MQAGTRPTEQLLHDLSISDARHAPAAELVPAVVAMQTLLNVLFARKRRVREAGQAGKHALAGLCSA